jgi:TalC/MipB family fructose-6-phosphate aldolase
MMELFVDSVDLDEIKAATAFGFVEGITTTPTFMHRQGIKDVDRVIVELSTMANQVHVEALGEDASSILEEANRLSALPGLSKTPVFKIPVTNEGLRAACLLAQQGKKTNIHLIYTLNQAYLAAASGASYVCPLVGRLHDQGHDSFALIDQVVNMVERYNYPAKIMVSSVRHPDHVRMAIRCGAHAITVPWKILRMMSENVLTGRGINDFSIHTKLSTYTVRQVIRPHNPVVTQDATIAEAAIEMTRSKLGAVSVVDQQGCLIGILTDGDLRRGIDRKDLAHEKVGRLMSHKPRSVPDDTLLQEAVLLMRQSQVDNLVVVDSRSRPVGMIDVQDLLSDGLID